MHMSEESNDRNESADAALKPDARRELIVMRDAAAGTRAIAIFSDETDGVTEARAITPLPDAPPSVLGVASVRGRMRTTLDPFQLLGAKAQAATSSDAVATSMQPDADASPCKLLVTLRGDEQLALCVSSIERTRDIQTDDIEPPPPDAPAVRGVLRHNDSNIFLLDPSKLFDAATHSTQRRRQRTKAVTSDE